MISYTVYPKRMWAQIKAMISAFVSFFLIKALLEYIKKENQQGLQ